MAANFLGLPLDLRFSMFNNISIAYQGKKLFKGYITEINKFVW